MENSYGKLEEGPGPHLVRREGASHVDAVANRAEDALQELDELDVSELRREATRH